MKNSGLVVSVCFVLLLASTPATAVVEGRSCLPEPTNEPIAYGDLIACNIDLVGDVDQFRFSGTAGETVVVQVASGSSQWAVVELWGPDGFKIGSNYGPTARVNAKLTQSGTHTILVSDDLNNQTMAYTLALERAAPPSDTASSVCPGCTSSDEINPFGDLDLYSFEGTAGDTVSAQVSTGSSQWAVVELWGPDGSKIGSNYGPTARVDAKLTQSGTHTILVSDDLNNQTMAYTVTYQCLGSCCATLRNYVDITSLPDMNGSGYAEVATLQAKDGKPIVIIKDSKNDTPLGSLTFFNADWVPIALTSLPDMNANGSSELAVLAYHKDTGVIIVKVMDVQTKKTLNWIQFFNADWRPKGLTSVQDMNSNNVAELAVLAVKKGAGNVEVWVKDALTRKLLNNIPFPK